MAERTPFARSPVVSLRTLTNARRFRKSNAAEPTDLEDVVGGALMNAGWLVHPGIYTSNALSAPVHLDLTESVACVEIDDGLVTLRK